MNIRAGLVSAYLDWLDAAPSRARSHSIRLVRPPPTIGGGTRQPTSTNEVAVLILDDALVDPPASLGSGALLSDLQRRQGVLSHAQEQAELSGLVIWVERRELTQVPETLAADVLDRVEIDLERAARRTNLRVPHSRALRRATRPKELFDRTTPPQCAKNE
ncbi:hypothetical protein ACGFYZ_21020 [Streptomyces sp. NPDC048330]|uniref:hypothetical protein n=1 Tax=Streptomyces sp. NPDC048330 TaxID=3365533 RepID=UPI003715E8C3